MFYFIISYLNKRAARIFAGVVVRTLLLLKVVIYGTFKFFEFNVSDKISGFNHPLHTKSNIYHAYSMSLVGNLSISGQEKFTAFALDLIKDRKKLLTVKMVQIRLISYMYCMYTIS
jgi:hypothetical protein